MQVLNIRDVNDDFFFQKNLWNRCDHVITYFNLTIFFRLQPSTKHSPSLILCAKYLIFGMSMIKSVLWQTPKESNLPRRLRVSKLKLLIAGQWKENIEFAMWLEDQLKCKVRKRNCQINFDNIKNLSNCSSHLTIFSTQF